MNRKSIPIAKSLTPPLFWEAARRSYGILTGRSYLSTQTYPSFDAAAAAAASSGAGDGYSDNDVAKLSLTKTLIYKERGWPEIAWHEGAGLYIALPYTANLVPKRPLRVLDFGGSFGFHAMLCAKTMPEIATKWAIVESPASVAIAKPVETDWLHAFNRIEEAMDWLGGADLMHSSGTIQYLADPDPVIAQLSSLRAEIMLWQRIMFANGPRTHVVEKIRLGQDRNGLGDFLPEGFKEHFVRGPCTYIPEADLQSICTKHGYRLGIRIPPENKNWHDGLASYGAILLFRRLTSAS